MAVTLLQVVQRVSRPVGLDPTITSFSNNDETNDLVQYVNEAYEELLIVLPSSTPFLNSSGTLSLTNGTRLYSVASNAMPFDLYEWSFINTTGSDAQITFATKDYINTLDIEYKTTAGTPTYAYVEGNQQVGFYPVPNASFTVTYEYGISSPARLTATSDTFLIPDRWVRYIEKSAQEKYERVKGYGDPDATALVAFNLLAEILVEAWETNPTYLLNEGIS